MKNNTKRVIRISVLLFSFVLLYSGSLLAKDLDLIKEKTFNVKSGDNLKVITDIGDVIVRAWNRDEVGIKIYGDSDAKRRMEFSFDQDENSVKVIGEKEGGKLFGWFSRVDLKYEINVPGAFNIELKTSGGDVVVKNIEGKLNLKTSGGDIYTKNTSGEIYGATSGGDIVLVNFTGNAEVATSGGDIKANASEGNLYASTSGGDIDLKASEGEVVAKTSGGDIVLHYQGENYGIKLVTSGGDIDVVLPPDFSADVNIRSSGGDLVTNFGKNKMSKISKSKLEGKFNDGGKPLVCKTSGGDIRVREK